MIIRGVPFDFVVETVERVGRERYAGNLITESWAKALPETSRTRHGGFSGRIIARSSFEPGARRAASGRRMPCVCWHGFRDVFIAIFEAYPDATIRTGLATYKGHADFLEKYPATGRTNVGSEMSPAAMANLCACGDDVPVRRREPVREPVRPVRRETVDGMPLVPRAAYDHEADAAWGPAMP